MGSCAGTVDHLVVLGDIHEQLVEWHLLLVAGAQHLGLLHPGDGQHRRVVELGVVQTVQQMDRAGPRCGQAHPEPPGRLGVGGRHEGGGFFVLHEHEADPVLVAPKPFHDPVDAVPGQPEDRVHAPVGQPLDERFGRDLAI